MTPAACLSAAIEVLADIDGRRRPAADALKDWGLSHRFAGSGDRAASRSQTGTQFDDFKLKESAKMDYYVQCKVSGAACTVIFVP